MVLKTTRFVSLICAALVLGLTVTHDLEIPGKQMLSGPEWLTVQQTFYGGFAIVGGITEILGLISTAFLAYLLREQRTVFILTLAAALSFAGMLALFAVGNNPLNQQVMSWTPATIPANWREIRNAWDSFHAASFALAALALILLLITTLQDMTSPALLRVGRISVLFAHSRLRRSPHFRKTPLRGVAARTPVGKDGGIEIQTHSKEKNTIT